MSQKVDLKYKSFDEVLRTHLKEKDKEIRGLIDNDWWWASDLGICQRKHFLRRLGVKRADLDPRISFLGAQGSAIHKWVNQAVKEMKNLVAANQRVESKKYRYRGKFDAIVNLGNPRHPYHTLVDVKTQRPEAFFRRSRLPIGQQVKWFQKMQLASYFYFVKKQYPFLKDARIYYMDRGGGVREEYIVKMSQSLFDGVLKELSDLNDCWKKKILPPCSHTFYCSDFCRPYAKELKQVEKGIISLEEFVKKHEY